MKIAFFTTVFCFGHSKFGISNAAYFLARHFEERHGSDIDVFAINTGEQKSDEKLGYINVKRFVPKIRSFFLSGDMLRSGGRHDIIHSFHYGYFPATSGFINSIINKTPHIFTPAFHPPIYTFVKKLISWKYGISQGYPIIRLSDKTLVFNEDEKKRLSKYVKGNFKTIPPPVDSRTFYPKRQESGKIRIGFIGPMLSWKGALIAADIFSSIQKKRKDVEFVFIGFGPLENEIRKRGNFKFYKELSPEDVAMHMNSIDILVSPTKYESFGYVLAEAGMCGTPVVSTRVGAVPETVGEGGILVDYGNWTRMKEDIEILIDDERKRKKLGKNAISHTKQFRDDEVSEKVYNVYKSIE